MIETTKKSKADASDADKALIARNQLIESHLLLVRKIAVQMFRSAPSYMSFDDLVSYGYQGLVGAAAAFDPQRGSTFECYATPRVRGAMQDGFRKEALFSSRRCGDDKSPRVTPSMFIAAVEPAGELAASLVGERGFTETPIVEEQTDYRRLVEKLSAVVDRLPTHLREFTETHYFKEVPLRDVARELGVSKYVVQRLRNSALREISSMLSTEHRTVPAFTRGLQ